MPPVIRDATGDDWSAIWALMQPIVAAADTFSWAPDTSEADARAYWMHERPGRTFVAVDQGGTVLGTAESHPNQPAGGPAGHVANAGFMVDSSNGRRGVGRALAEHTIAQARADGFRAMQFNAVASTNTHAVRLWESLGFAIVASLPGAFHHPTQDYVDLLVMYRSLL